MATNPSQPLILCGEAPYQPEHTEPTEFTVVQNYNRDYSFVVFKNGSIIAYINYETTSDKYIIEFTGPARCSYIKALVIKALVTFGIFIAIPSGKTDQKMLFKLAEGFSDIKNENTIGGHCKALSLKLGAHFIALSIQTPNGFCVEYKNILKINHTAQSFFEALFARMAVNYTSTVPVEEDIVPKPYQGNDVNNFPPIQNKITNPITITIMEAVVEKNVQSQVAVSAPVSAPVPVVEKIVPEVPKAITEPSAPVLAPIVPMSFEFMMTVIASLKKSGCTAEQAANVMHALTAQSATSTPVKIL